MLTREEWQENEPVPIDSVTEAEQDLRDRNELIRLLGHIVYQQNLIIRNACDEDGSPRVDYDTYAGMDWHYHVVRDAYRTLVDDLLSQLPKDWLTTLEV